MPDKVSVPAPVLVRAKAWAIVPEKLLAATLLTVNIAGVVLLLSVTVAGGNAAVGQAGDGLVEAGQVKRAGASTVNVACRWRARSRTPSLIVPALIGGAAVGVGARQGEGARPVLVSAKLGTAPFDLPEKLLAAASLTVNVTRRRCRSRCRCERPHRPGRRPFGRGRPGRTCRCRSTVNVVPVGSGVLDAVLERSGADGGGAAVGVNVSQGERARPSLGQGQPLAPLVIEPENLLAAALLTVNVTASPLSVTVPVPTPPSARPATVWARPARSNLPVPFDRQRRPGGQGVRDAVLDRPALIVVAPRVGVDTAKDKGSRAAFRQVLRSTDRHRPTLADRRPA